MLKELSVKNARRQMRNYIFFFTTMAGAAALIYSFNSLIYSEVVHNLKGLDILPYMILAASILIIFILGFLVNYMTGFILKKRSREFSIYMVLGIENSKISQLFMAEMFLIGLWAFAIGMVVGILLSKVLEIIIFSVLGVPYVIALTFSVKAIFLSLLYFILIYFFALVKNAKLIKRTELCDLLNLEKLPEPPDEKKSIKRIALFFLSIFAGAFGLYLFLAAPLGNGLDAFLGFTFTIIFIFGFFSGISSFGVNLILKMGDWRFRSERLLLFRSFTSKTQVIRRTLSILTILFMFSITAVGMTAAISQIVEKSMELSIFDLVILHTGDVNEMKDYDMVAETAGTVTASHSYNLYTSDSTLVKEVRENAIRAYGNDSYEIYQEFMTDTYMSYTDYVVLCEMLQYETPELSDSGYLMQGVRGLKDNIEHDLSHLKIELPDGTLEYSGFMDYSFNQVDAYGNGLDYIIILPDAYIETLPVLYSVYAALTEAPINNSQLQALSESDHSLTVMQRNEIIATEEGATQLYDAEKDYLSGKWAMKESYFEIYSFMIMLLYVAFIFEITGLAILATQLLSASIYEKPQYQILSHLGMTYGGMKKIIYRQTALLFAVPCLPALLIGTAIQYIGAKGIEKSMYTLPVFESSGWILISILQSGLVFLVVYIVYFCLAVKSYRKAVDLPL